MREQRAREANFDPDKSKLSGERVFRSLEPCVERGYNDMWEVWEESVLVSFTFVIRTDVSGNRYCETSQNCDIFDEQTKKHFIIFLGKITKGMQSLKDPRPKPSTTCQRWKRFTANWARKKGEQLPHNVTHSGRMVEGLSHP
ncbi:hypothetical protein ACJ73_07287 [Blastomyces percursus]|uniref:Uncharacterized protein n=1 Tax=Blastomyces percursus TaxID=1658174 RepID=A0A1J9QYU2_9EURO|nr:hypothetical protein ACJ73_07287 [Blastomyces percursus]